MLDDLPVAVVKAQPATPVEQIIDNGAEGFATTGAWSASTAIAGYLGTNYLAHAPGANAVGAIAVDNADAGFSVPGTWEVSTAVAGYLGANYRVHAPNGSPPTAVGVDNTDAGASSTGTWTASTSVSGFVGANYQTRAAGTGALKRATVQLLVPDDSHEWDELESGSAAGALQGALDLLNEKLGLVRSKAARPGTRNRARRSQIGGRVGQKAAQGRRARKPQRGG